MPKVKLDVGATVDFLNKDELADELDKNQQRAEAFDRERLAGVKYMRAPRIQGTVYSGTINGSSTGTGTNTQIGGPPWGPQQGYAWSVRRLCVGGLANAGTGICDIVGIYRNNVNSPPIAMVTANNPAAYFPTLGLVLNGGDCLLLGHIPNQVPSNTYGTLTGTFLQADFDVIEVPEQKLGALA